MHSLVGLCPRLLGCPAATTWQHSSILAHNSVSGAGCLSLGHRQSSASTKCGKERKHLFPQLLAPKWEATRMASCLKSVCPQEGEWMLRPPPKKKTKGLHSPPTPSCCGEFKQEALIVSYPFDLWSRRLVCLLIAGYFLHFISWVLVIILRSCVSHPRPLNPT